MKRPLVLCADDFGLSAAINEGILQLARRGRLSAVSCLVNGPAWAVPARELAALAKARQGRLGLGLHFNLTEGAPLSATLARHWPTLPPLPRLLVLAHLRQLPVAALRDELQAQWDAFVQASGRLPDHVDGHQHVHALPQVRDALLAALAGHPLVRVRDTGQLPGPGFAFKRLVIERSGGRKLRGHLHAQGRQANQVLLGVYDFADPDYRALMRRWLAALPASGGMIFCHPGQSAAADDPIGAARVRELAYLGSDQFSADLAAAHVRLRS